MVNNRYNRWYKLLSSINQVVIILTIIAAIFWFGVFLFTNYSVTLFISGLAGLDFIFCSLSLLVLRISHEFSPLRLNIATWVNVLAHLVVISLAVNLLGATSGIVAMYFWTPMLVAILGMSVNTLILTTALTLILIFTSVIVQGIGLLTPMLNIASDIPIANAFLWVITLLAILAGLIIFKSQLEAALNESDKRANELQMLSDHLTTVVKTGSELGTELYSATAELRATSQQQASTASEQATSVVQVTSSIMELAETAKSIASNSTQVSQAVNQCLEIAKDTETKSESVNSMTSDGEKAVDGVTLAIEAVRNRIESLAQRLLILTERSKEIGSIIDLMREIADETHLLALNAAIESADGRTVSNDGGRRFGVIAGEVKNLADRSLESAQDVQKVIVEVQGAIATAVLAAEEGKKETIRAVNQARNCGGIINSLGGAAEIAAESVRQIVEAVKTVGLKAEEISLATQQQGSASDQVIVTMETIKETTQQTASASSQILATATQIDNRMGSLNKVLVEPDLTSLKAI